MFNCKTNKQKKKTKATNSLLLPHQGVESISPLDSGIGHALCFAQKDMRKGDTEAS